MAAHGATKAVPDTGTLAEKVRDRFAEMVAEVFRDALVERFQIEALLAQVSDADAVADAIESIAEDVVTDFTPASIADAFADDPQQPWDDVQQAYLDDVIEDERETLLAALDDVIAAERDTIIAAIDAALPRPPEPSS